MAKILITGGAGFIAYHLTQRLAASGHTVVGFDSFNDFYDPALKYHRAQKLYTESHIQSTIKIGDLRDAKRLSEILSAEKPDLIMHLGAYAGVRHSLEFPQLYIDNNITGTQNLIDAAKAAGVTRVVYASTSCTMAGNPLPWKEDLPQHHQLNPYGFSKRVNECQFKMAGFEAAIGLRFFTVYGPWGRPDMALFTFTKNILDRKPITVYNFGDMKRDFTYVDDIVQGVCIVIERALGATEKMDEIYNIGYGKQVNLMDFIHAIEGELGIEGIYDMQPKHPADTQETWSDTTKLQALGYKSTTPIEVGVHNFIKWYRSYYN